MTVYESEARELVGTQRADLELDIGLETLLNTGLVGQAVNMELEVPRELNREV